jgi:hypothetical protein
MQRATAHNMRFTIVVQKNKDNAVMKAILQMASLS